MSIIFLILFLLSTSSVNAESLWDLSGTYRTGPNWIHSMTIDSMDLRTGEFNGTGFYIPDPSVTWIINGTVTDSQFISHLVYTGKAKGYWSNWSAAINCAGEISGTFLDSNGYSDSFTLEGRATSVLGASCNNNIGPPLCGY